MKKQIDIAQQTVEAMVEEMDMLMAITRDRLSKRQVMRLLEEARYRAIISVMRGVEK